MALTSTAINMCNAVIHMADNLGVTYDISGSSNNFDIENTNDIGDYKVFGTAGRGRAGGPGTCDCEPSSGRRLPSR